MKHRLREVPLRLSKNLVFALARERSRLLLGEKLAKIGSSEPIFD